MNLSNPCESLSNSVICTDKTGTLTTNEMTAVSLVVFEEDRTVVEHNIIGSSYSPVGHIDGIMSGEEIKSFPYGSVTDIAAVSALCNDAKIVGHDKHAEDEKDYERVGEPTEGKCKTDANSNSILAHALTGRRFCSCALYLGGEDWRDVGFGERNFCPS